MLEKRLELGGLQVGGPRTLQSPARFRVADNVYQTIDNYYVPRWRNSVSLSLVKNIFAFHIYKEKFFYLVEDGTHLVARYEGVEFGGVQIPKPVDGKGIQFLEKQGCLYFHIPGKGLWKFDGVRAHRAGAPQLVYSAGASHTSDFQEGWFRVIVTHLDFQGNAVHSGYSDQSFRYKASDTSRSTSVSLSTQLGDGRLMPEDGFPAYGIKNISAVTQDDIAGTVTVTSGSHKVKVGEYLFYIYSFGTTISTGDVSIEMIAYKVLAITGNNITLGEAKVKINDEWVNWDYVNDWNLNVIGNFSVLGNYFAHVFVSGNETGTYVFKDVEPIWVPESGFTHFEWMFDGNVTTPITPGPRPIGLSPILGDAYAVESNKILFPAKNSGSMTVLAGTGFISYDHEIYHSDPTLGGNFEMTEGLAFIVVGEENEGKVVSVCGAEDYLLVSRKFQNHFVSGNIITNNYTTRELVGTSLGAITNESTVKYGANILLMNATGVWLIGSGGSCKELSVNIRGLFSDFSDSPKFDEEEIFNISEVNEIAGAWVKPRVDVSRGLVAFVTKGLGEGKALVLNMNNGEFYTWTKLVPNLSPDIRDFRFWKGDYYIASKTQISKEDKTIKLFGDYKPQLISTWLTYGEPSLDKKLTQIKLWGLLEGEVQVTQYSNWKDPATHTKSVKLDTDFSQKIRINSDNNLAGSVGIEFNKAFYLEGLEIEFSLMQEGMKK